MIHELKTLKPYFDAVISGDKTFEVRKNDRDFKVGDFLALNEITIEKKYTGRCCMLRITYVMTDEKYVKQDYAILGIEVCAIASGGMECNWNNTGRRVPWYGGEDEPWHG